MATPVQTLIQMLEQAAHSEHDTGVLSYPVNDVLHPREVGYAQLLDQCSKNALSLRRNHGLKPKEVVLLHLSDHLDNIVWFWSVLLAGGIPALSSPLPNDKVQRRQHLNHLSTLFSGPACLMRRASFADFSVCPGLVLLAIDDIDSEVVDPSEEKGSATMPTIKPEDLAALMLTSGSTGNAKAVELTHRQVLASVRAKDSVTSLAPGTSLLNWLGMDHVAALVETHLLAVYRRLDQVHIQAADIVSEPLLLLKMMTTHHVARTVAPNFLLARLHKAITRCGTSELAAVDLSRLTQLVSGGQENPVLLCVELDQELQRLGAPAGVLQPAFGMTETCAGCTYNTACPVADLSSGMGFASLGRSVGGLEMRVVSRANYFTPQGDERSECEQRGARGPLHVRGPMVFSQYYNNPHATAEAFTADGWFDTGDEAVLDASGNVHLVGRIKDLIRINGLGIVASDIERQLDALGLPGAVAQSYAAFGYRAHPTADESLAVLYVPAPTPADGSASSASTSSGQQTRSTHDAIVDSILQSHRVRPYVLAVDAVEMHTSTLGKVSRGKLRRALEGGTLQKYEGAHGCVVTAPPAVQPSTQVEAQLLAIFQKTFEQPRGVAGSVPLGVRTPWYRWGVTSIELIRLSHRIKVEWGLSVSPLDKLLSCSTIAQLASQLPQPRTRRDTTATTPTTGMEGVVAINDPPPAPYNPVKTLRPEGSQTPLWLFHPGVGEVLVFINLAKQVRDRPVYALRARGFNPGEPFFASIDEAVEVYYRAIKEQQPDGPYALCGYSFGAMLAFETAKKLNSDGRGDQVAFLASFNLPPHIKFRMRQLDWCACAMHLGHFLGLLDDPDVEDAAPLSGSGSDSDSHTAVVSAIFAAAPPHRLTELSLTTADFLHWADLAHAMQTMARDYEPRGNVPSIDVFYCQPLAVVAQTTQQWLDVHLHRWHEVASDVRFHHVAGQHYTMIDTDHVTDFMRTFSLALAARGLC